jgi:hypothetical protein
MIDPLKVEAGRITEGPPEMRCVRSGGKKLCTYEIAEIKTASSETILIPLPTKN